MSGSARVSENDHPAELQGLLRKLTDIGAEIERNRHHLERLTAELSRVDSAIRAVSHPAGTGLTAVPVEKSLPGLVLDVLAGKRQAMSAREIALAVMTVQGFDVADVPRLRQITHRVCVSLWVHNQKGLVNKIEVGPSRFRWEIIRE